MIKSIHSTPASKGLREDCARAAEDYARTAEDCLKALDAGRAYVGRFAPSPTGPLHAGSLQTALASWLDARAHKGKWLLRIEDVDAPRCSIDAAYGIINCLAAHGLQPDGAVGWQSQRRERYDRAIDQLQSAGLLYLCSCSRSRIAAALRESGWVDAPHRERPYPGLCRQRMRSTGAGALRLCVNAEEIAWEDRRLGSQAETLALSLGDFVLRRADGIDSYHLAVVVDDEADGVTDVVRGDDLLASTARQIALQRHLGYRGLRYLHLPVLRDSHGEKLSKQQGAAALSPENAASNLRAAAERLGLGRLPGASVPELLAQAVARWSHIFVAAPC